MRNSLSTFALLLLFAATASAAAPNVSLLAPEGSVNEGAVAISPVNPRICVAAGIHFATTGTTVETFRTADAGATWTANGALPGVGGFTRQWDPVLLFDRSGAAYLTVVGATADDHLWTIVVYRSTDGGATWSAVDAAKNAAGRTDKPWLAIDTSGGAFDGSLYTAWFTFGNAGHNGMHMAWSRDRGATWSETNTVFTSGWPFIATGTDGSVYASYYDAGTNQITGIRSDDGGVTFGAPFAIAPERTLVPGTVPYGTSAHQMAAGGGNLYVTYPCDSDGAGHPPSSVCFTRSLNRGAAWSSPLRLSSPAQESGLPSIAVDKTNGEVLLTWIGRDASSDTASCGSRARATPARRSRIRDPSPTGSRRTSRPAITTRARRLPRCAWRCSPTPTASLRRAADVGRRSAAARAAGAAAPPPRCAAVSGHAMARLIRAASISASRLTATYFAAVYFASPQRTITS